VVEYFPVWLIRLHFIDGGEPGQIARKASLGRCVSDFYTPFSREWRTPRKYPKTQIEPEKVGRTCPEDGGEWYFEMEVWKVH
jgi:hypothetical protein